MSTRPVELSPALAAAIARARETLEAEGELRPRPGGYRSPLGPEARAAVAAFIADGTYRRLADMVAADDPEIADL